MTIKARYVRYKETEGSVVWQPDLAAASELSLVVVLILQGLTSIEFLQQACTCVAGVLAALCVYPHAHAHPACCHHTEPSMVMRVSPSRQQAVGGTQCQHPYVTLTPPHHRCVLFRCHRPKGSVLVKSDKNDRLVAASGA